MRASPLPAVMATMVRTAAMLAAAPALAQSDARPDPVDLHQDVHQPGSDGPRFCPTRPSIGGSSCTTEPGHVQFEASLLDWERDDRRDSREDRILAADLLARFGVGPKTEVQVGWTGFGHDRERDRPGDDARVVDGTGDVTLAVRQHLAGQEGRPFSFGVQPFVTLPAGRYPVGAGTWSAGVVVPFQYELTERLATTFTGEADAAANGAGDGRHLAYSGIETLRYKLTPAVNVYAELEVERDDDPSGHETHALFALSTAWRPARRFQLDVLAAAGLNRDTPDIRLVTGGAVLF